MMTLCSLPPEMLGMIVSNITEVNDLKSLRQTCRQLNVPASIKFGSTLLAHGRFVIAPKSLRRLVDQTAHPQIGPCMRSISLGTCCPRDALHENDRGEEESWWWKRRRMGIKSISPGTAQWIKEDRHVDLLVEALTNLQRYNNRIVVGAFDDVITEVDFPIGEREYFKMNHDQPEPKNRTCYGIEELFRGNADRWTRNFYTEKSRNPVRTLEIWQAACREANFTVPCLKLDIQYMDNQRFSVMKHGSRLDQKLEEMFKVRSGWFSQEVDLDLTLNVKRRWNSVSNFNIRHKDRSLELNNVSLIMGHELCSWQMSRLNSKDFGYLGKAIGEAQFRKIIMERCLCDTWFVDQFLASKSETLASLDLHHVVIFYHYRGDGIRTEDDENSSVAKLLKFLKDGLSLERLWMSKIRAGKMKWLVDDMMVLRGREEICTALDKLLEEWFWHLENDDCNAPSPTIV